MTCSAIDVRRVFEAWTHACACDLGADITDCPGPPSRDRIERVRTWLTDTTQPIDEYPFNEPDSWGTFLDLHG